jgi:hypothetical protein
MCLHPVTLAACYEAPFVRLKIFRPSPGKVFSIATHQIGDCVSWYAKAALQRLVAVLIGIEVADIEEFRADCLPVLQVSLAPRSAALPSLLCPGRCRANPLRLVQRSELLNSLGTKDLADRIESSAGGTLRKKYCLLEGRAKPHVREGPVERRSCK